MKYDNVRRGAWGMNFYAILGIPLDADDDAIRSAYRLLARRYHPDRGVGSSAEKFRQVNEAYETLIDPGSRESYDFSIRSVEPRIPIVVEPLVSQSGRFAAPQPLPVFPTAVSFDELFDRLMRQHWIGFRVRW
jgi:DnaJ-class molecular chaperone